MKRRGVILCTAVALTAPSLAAAAPPAATSPLQTELATRLLDFIDYKNAVRRGMENAGLPPELLAVRPAWGTEFKAAVSEELDHDMPIIKGLLGATLGKTFSEDEMKAGLKIVADPNLRAIYIAANTGAPEPHVQIAKATEDLLATPAGSSFASKLQNIQTVLDPVQMEVMATVMPGVLRRFGEKAEADEAKRRAAGGSAPTVK